MTLAIWANSRPALQRPWTLGSEPGVGVARLRASRPATDWRPPSAGTPSRRAILFLEETAAWSALCRGRAASCGSWFAECADRRL